MPRVINTNIASLNAQRALNTSQSDVSTALQRLSAGLRINTAKDDAASRHFRAFHVADQWVEPGSAQ